MDVKTALNSILPTATRSTPKTGARIKTSNTSDRDANGQQAYQQNNGDTPQRPMNDEELERALDHLRMLPVVVDHGLNVSVSFVGDKKFVLISESSGKVVRRIPEVELWSLQKAKEGDKGQLLRKAA